MGEFGVHPERPSAKGRNLFWCSHSTLQVSNVLGVFQCVHWHWLPSNHTSNPGSRKVFGHFPWSRTGLPQKPKQKSGPAREQTPGDRPQAPSSALKRPQEARKATSQAAPRSESCSVRRPCAGCRRRQRTRGRGCRRRPGPGGCGRRGNRPCRRRREGSVRRRR